jgi:hypothetical protein
MRILKTEMSNLRDDDEPSSPSGAQAPMPPQQIAAAGTQPGTPVSDAQHQNQPS